MKKNVLAVLSVLLILLVMLGGCSSGAAVSGWAGITIVDGNIITVSGRGQLNVVSVSDLTSVKVVPIEESGSSGFSCAPASSAVPIYSTPAVMGDWVYMAGYNGKIYAYNLVTTELKSQVLDKDKNQAIVGGPLAYGGRVFVASSNGYVYALDASNLSEVWKFKTGAKIWSTPVLSNGVLFVGSFDKKIYAIDVDTGAEKWSKSIDGAMMATPLVADGVVYAVSLDRHIYAFDEATGALKWKYPAGNQSSNPKEWFWATPVLLNGFLYAPCLDGKVYAVDVANIANVKVFDLGHSISASPVVSAGKVVAVTEEGKVYTLDATSGASGEQRLIKELRVQDSQPSLVVRSQLSAAGGVVYIHSLYPDKIYAVNIETGAVNSFALEAVASSPGTTMTVTETVTSTETKTVTTTVTTTVTN